MSRQTASIGCGHGPSTGSGRAHSGSSSQIHSLNSGQAKAKPPVTDLDQMFEQAVAMHSRRMLAVARGIVGNRACPEDVVQQALTNLYQHRHRYDWRDPGGLIRRAVVNEAIRILRHPRMVRVADDHPGHHHSPASRMLDGELVEKVRAAIERLPAHFRAALILCEYENMAYTQIAEVLGVTMPQVKTWLHRGRRQLAGMLEEFVQPARSARGDLRDSPSFVRAAARVMDPAAN